jgi:hypothetical protein
LLRGVYLSPYFIHLVRHNGKESYLGIWNPSKLEIKNRKQDSKCQKQDLEGPVSQTGLYL